MDDESFAAFAQAASPQLLRAAWLLTGDWHTAHDLVQTALEKSWTRWGRRSARPTLVEHPEGYVRRVMVTTFLSWRRRRWSAEVPTGQLPEIVGVASPGTDLRLSLLSALTELTPRQRAVLVLRFFEDQSEAQTAELLGCSVGSVKAHASRGLERLRTTPDLAASLGVEARDD